MRLYAKQALYGTVHILNIKFITLLLIAACRFSVSAFNHPEIEWKSVSTRHFHIHYYNKTEPAVYAAWKIAEEAYEVFDSLYHYNAQHKIHLALADYDDFSNGFAAWTQRTIMVWVPDAHFDLRSNTTWLRDVITHELAHIMSLEKKKGMQLLDWTFAFQYTSPNVNVTYGEPIPLMTFFPMWFAEGTAQLRAEQMGSDCWDSRRDMVLRCAVMDNKTLSLDEMGHFTHNVIGNEMVYNQGYSFTKYLENNIGREKAARIWNNNRGRKFFGTSMERNVSRTFNLSLDEMYANWKDSLKTNYEAEKPSDITSVTPVWEKGTMNAMPRVSSDGRYWGWLTNHKDDFDRTDLVIANYGESVPIMRIKYAQTDWDFSPDGNTVYYIKSRRPNKKGSYLKDIFSCDINEGKENQLTNSARIYAVTASPNGKDLLCVQYKQNSFSLVLFSMSSKKFETIVEGVPGEPFLTASFFPSSDKKLIVSKIVQGKAGLFILDISGGNLEPLVNTEAQEESPFCARDGRIYFSADYDGIFNIYSLLPDGSDLKRHTSVTGGVFSPVFDGNGKLLLSEYTSDGFRIAQCAADGIQYEIPNTPVCLFEPLPTPRGKVRIKASEYKPIYLRPSWELFTSLVCTDMDKALQDRITEGEIRDSSWNIYLDFATEIGMVRSDAVGQKDMYLGGAIIVMAGWHDDHNSSDTDTISKQSANIFPTLSRTRYNARPRFMRRRDQRLNGTVSPALIRDIRRATAVDASDNDTDDTEESPISIPYLVPFFGVENRQLKPTIGVDAMVVLVTMIPVIINVDPYIELHVARDLYVGLSPTFSIIPMLLFTGEEYAFAMSSPVWIQWIYRRYLNEDYYYNKAGVTNLRGFIGPEITPYISKEVLYDSTGSSTDYDTTLVTSLSFGIQCMHAFPFFKYGSFSIRTENYGKKYNQKVSGAVGTIDSVGYRFLLTSMNRTAFTFPIFRNINRGRLYADNLYGTLFYQLDFYGTDRFFKNPRKDVFIDKKFMSDNASVSHWIGLGIEFGFIKSYMFDRSLRMEASWDIFDEEFNVEMSLWF